MKESERDEILWRLDERTKKVDDHLERLDQRVEENEKQLDKHNNRITDNEATLETVTKAGGGLIGFIVTTVSGILAHIGGFLKI